MSNIGAPRALTEMAVAPAKRIGTVVGIGGAATGAFVAPMAGLHAYAKLDAENRVAKGDPDGEPGIGFTVASFGVGFGGAAAGGTALLRGMGQKWDHGATWKSQAPLMLVGAGIAVGSIWGAFASNKHNDEIVDDHRG